jgi:glyoxylase-like metal-dependent hydrolase (beta-lactamase superfamily II)
MTPRELSYEVLVADGVPRQIDLRLPNGDEIVSLPISSTLVAGEHDAVLVDPPLTHAQIAQVADGVARSGKRLVSVYITHGHPDHWFGTATLLDGSATPRARYTPPRAPSGRCASNWRARIRLLAGRPKPLEFFEEMVKLHGDRLNPGPLWYSALGLLG